MPQPVVICPYDPAWAQRYAALRAQMMDLLGDTAQEIAHIGSTSVPGLAAKPIIDLNIVLRTADDLPAVIARLAGVGYAHEGDLGITGREAFAVPEGASQDHHLYVCRPDWCGHRDQIAFRDYLREHPSAARAYGRRKYALAKRFGTDRAGYSSAKSGFIAAVLKRARD